MDMKMMILAAAQGITEFLPVSSSGHIVVFKELFGLNCESGPVLEILLHAGTLVSVLIFYWQKILDLTVGVIRWEKAALNYAFWLILATIPAGMTYLFLGDYIDQAFSSSKIVSVLLLLTGLILLSTRLVWNTPETKNNSWWRALIVGISQAIAILPGISRSGSTISMAKWLKISTREAFDFSFLMSVPILFAGILLKIKDLSALSETASGGIATIIGAFVISAITGYCALNLIVKWGLNGKFWLFGFYCLAAGALFLILL